MAVKFPRLTNLKADRSSQLSSTLLPVLDATRKKEHTHTEFAPLPVFRWQSDAQVKSLIMNSTIKFYFSFQQVTVCLSLVE